MRLLGHWVRVCGAGITSTISVDDLCAFWKSHGLLNTDTHAKAPVTSPLVQAIDAGTIHASIYAARAGVQNKLGNHLEAAADASTALELDNNLALSHKEKGYVGMTQAPLTNIHAYPVVLTMTPPPHTCARKCLASHRAAILTCSSHPALP
jgi:hypothetical protein